MSLEDRIQQIRQQKAEADAFAARLPERKQKWESGFSQLRTDFVRALDPLVLAGQLTLDQPTEMVRHSEFGEFPVTTLTINIEGIVLQLTPGLQPIIGFPGDAELAVLPYGPRSRRIDIFRLDQPQNGEIWFFKAADMRKLDRFLRLDGDFIPARSEHIKTVIDQLLS